MLSIHWKEWDKVENSDLINIAIFNTFIENTWKHSVAQVKASSQCNLWITYYKSPGCLSKMHLVLLIRLLPSVSLEVTE